MSISYDVVVVGGGLLGSVSAFLLASAGATVALIERDYLNEGASGRNAGSIHMQLEYRMIEHGRSSARRAAEAIPLHLDAVSRWERHSRDLGPALGLSLTGGFMVADSAAATRRLEEKVAIEREYGLPVELLDIDETLEKAPYLAPTIQAASFCPLEGKADARLAAVVFARAAKAAGASILTGHDVIDLEYASSGTWAVTTQSDARRRTHHSDQVVLAAGAWTRELGRLVGVDLPLTTVPLMMTVSARTAPFLPHLIQHAEKRLSLKQVPDGNVLIGGGWPAAMEISESGSPTGHRSGQIIPSMLHGNLRAALDTVPRLAHLNVTRTWVGATTVGPQQLPLLGPIPGLPGAFVASGGSAFTLAPSFAHVLVQLLAGHPVDLDISPYLPERWV